MSKIISGGQTGADQGALIAARALGIETGGYAPKDWLTEDGPRQQVLRGFGLIECEEAGYPARTRRNVVHSDGTLLVGRHNAGGSRLTFETVMALKKPLFLLEYSNVPYDVPDAKRGEFRSWLTSHDIRVLNVAGNRESESPGIAEFTHRFLLSTLTVFMTGLP